MFSILVALAWIYVVLLMAVAEATSPVGSLLGALVTFVLYGALPLAIVLYLLDAPRRATRRRAEASAGDPDGGGHAAGDAVAAKREEG